MSTVLFGILTFLINREKLTKKYRMVMVRNRDLSVYVNTTLKIANVIDKYIRGTNTSVGPIELKSTTVAPVKMKTITTVPPVKRKPDVWRKQFNWRDCKRFKKGSLNRTEALYQQLKKVVRVLNRANYIVGYGTLLGVVRDNQMNPNEVDNDIIVDQNFDPDPYKERLFNMGLIIFKSGIYRICEYNPVQSANKNPWTAGYYSTYTDIYNQLPYVLVDPENPNTAIRKKVIIRQRKFRDMSVNIPQDTVINEWFSKRYGNWKVPSIKGWKKKVKNTFK